MVFYEEKVNNCNVFRLKGVFGEDQVVVEEDFHFHISEKSVVVKGGIF
jgi:hypothetical protein